MSFTDLTVKYTELSFLRIVIFPIPPKKDCIFSNKTLSLLFKLIVKTGTIFQPVLYNALLSTNITKEASPSCLGTSYIIRMQTIKLTFRI